MFDTVSRRGNLRTAAEQSLFSASQVLVDDLSECPLAWAREANAYVCVSCLNSVDCVLHMLNLRGIHHVEHDVQLHNEAGSMPGCLLRDGYACGKSLRDISRWHRRRWVLIFPF